jgi:membrane fusion protein, multidrug efflux system
MARTDNAVIKNASAERVGDAGENVRRLTASPDVSEPTVAERQQEASEPQARARQAPLSEPVAMAPATAPTPPARKFPTRPVLFALLPVALVIGAYVYVTGGATMSTDNAYVQADMVGVANDVAGIVSTIAVKENQKVAVGDVLFTLDQKPFQLALDRANAQLGSTRNDLLASQANYRNMQAQIEQAQADIAYYDVTFQRQQALAKKNFTPQSSFDNARRDLQVAQQKLVSLKQQLAGIAASLNGAPDAAVEDYPKYKDMLAARDEAARQLDHTTVRAPIAGIATKVPSLQPGQYLAASTSAIAIVATDHLWVQAQPKETELTYVHPGQKAIVEVDTYPGVQWSGTVESVSPASASSFSLLPAENTSGNWVRVVQRIPMRVRLDSAPDKPQLRMGMSVELSVATGHPRGVPSVIKHLFGFGEA